MLRRRSTSEASTNASAYSRRAVVADSVWAVQDRVRNGLGSAAKATADAVRWPFERGAYALQERLIWPAEDRADSLGPPARGLAFGAVVLLAVGAGVAGLIWAAPDRPHNTAAIEVAATSVPREAKAPAAEPKPPTLHGATPIFKPVEEQGRSEVDPAKAIVKSAPAEQSASADAPDTAAATSSASPRSAEVDGAPAGPEAISVARDFAGAFVLYETGETDSTVRRAFGETATPALSRALLERPPRLPANVEVPKAKVVNVVPAPSHGDVYPVSVSLLRVGLTSELRLDLEERKGDGWRVTNVLG